MSSRLPSLLNVEVPINTVPCALGDFSKDKFILTRITYYSLRPAFFLKAQIRYKTDPLSKLVAIAKIKTI